jgi:hypothetical protein
MHVKRTLGTLGAAALVAFTFAGIASAAPARPAVPLISSGTLCDHGNTDCLLSDVNVAATNSSGGRTVSYVNAGTYGLYTAWQITITGGGSTYYLTYCGLAAGCTVPDYGTISEGYLYWTTTDFGDDANWFTVAIGSNIKSDQANNETDGAAAELTSSSVSPSYVYCTGTGQNWTEN